MHYLFLAYLNLRADLCRDIVESTTAKRMQCFNNSFISDNINFFQLISMIQLVKVNVGRRKLLRPPILAALA